MGQSKILGARMVTICKLHTENPQILGAIVHGLVPWRPGGRGLFTSELTLTTQFYEKH
jgi:hypothetical protein